MLLNLLPGLRDLRAPLAAGYLWLAAGWLYFAPELPASVNGAQGVLQDVHRVIQASSPVAVGVGLTFVAYMAGILSTGLLTRPIRIIVRLPLMVFFVLPLSILIELSDRSRLIEQLLEDLVGFYERLRRRLAIPPSPSNRIRTLVVRRISSKLVTDRESRNVFLVQLKSQLEKAFLHDPPFHELFALRSMYRLRILMDEPFAKEDKGSGAVRVLTNALDEKYAYLEASEVLVKTVVDVDRHADDIAEEMRLIPERLVGDKPATYERWDRLRAESEFRQAVVPPLVAIIAALFSRGALSWPIGLLSIVPPIIILAQGIDKENKADGQLIQALEAGVVSAAPIDRLTTTDLYWLNSDPGQDRQILEQTVNEDGTLGARQGTPEDEAVDRQVGTTKPGGSLNRKG